MFSHSKNTLDCPSDLEIAIQHLLERIKTHPDSAEIRANLGGLYILQQKWPQAIAYYCQAIELNPKFAGAYRNLARVLILRGQRTQAIQCWHRALSLEPQMAENFNLGFTNPEDYLQLGKLFKKQSRYKQAIHCFQKALELDLNFKPAYIALQYTPIESGQLAPLIAFYQQLVHCHPNLAIAWGNLGDALTQQGKIDDAIACYRQSSYQQAIASNPRLSKLDWKPRKKRMPDFIIIGAAKCGTTSLYQYLGFHPQILFPHKKELNFFDRHFALGLDWYLAQFPSITDRAKFVTGEASPNYFCNPEAARAIAKTYPQMKLIVLLRNPVERTISWYYHQVNRGAEKKSVEAAIISEIQQLKTLKKSDFNTIERLPAKIVPGSLYVYHLQFWINLFPREQFLILKSEDLYGTPAGVMERVFNFLNLSPVRQPRYLKYNTNAYPPIGDDLRNTLVDFFRPHNRKLEKYLGSKFNWD
jgi:tetratricopeptide (TPR) repeat protein